MELNIHAEESGTDYQDVVSIRFKEALVNLLNSFHQAKGLSKFYQGRVSADFEGLTHAAFIAQKARTAKDVLEQLIVDYSIIPDPKLKIVPMHDYVCETERELCSRSVA